MGLEVYDRVMIGDSRSVGYGHQPMRQLSLVGYPREIGVEIL
jgi:hypothetical protein